MFVHPGQIVMTTVGGVQIAKRDDLGHLIYTCCAGGESCEESAFHEVERARGELAYAPDTMTCYECGGFNGESGPEKKVVKLGPVVDRADPTQTYVLECGHTAI